MKIAGSLVLYMQVISPFLFYNLGLGLAFQNDSSESFHIRSFTQFVFEQFEPGL